jgi:hypothetical protein
LYHKFEEKSVAEAAALKAKVSLLEYECVFSLVDVRAPVAVVSIFSYFLCHNLMRKSYYATAGREAEDAES